jgi:uncharacterized membrane protein
MDHNTAVLVLINAMQSDKTSEDIKKEIDTLLQTVVQEERDEILKEATEKYKRIAAGLPFNADRA